MEHSYFNLMLYLFQEDCKQPEGYKVDLLNIHMIQDNTTDYLTLIIVKELLFLLGGSRFIMKRRFSRCTTFNQCEKNLTCSILSLYSYISRIIDMHTNRGRACRSPRSSIQNANLIQIR
jgi:hypothetical protein